MRKYDDMTSAMWYIVRSWSTYGAVCWIQIQTDEVRLDALGAKLDEAYGTALPPEKRRWRRDKKLPVAWAVSTPVLGLRGVRMVILLATEEALSVDKNSPFSREKWNTKPVELGDFVLTRDDVRVRGDYAWTWKIKERQLGLMEKNLIALVKSGDSSGLANCANRYVQLYPVFGGVRRGLRRLFKGAEKLWVASSEKPWPGPDPENLPMMTKFKA